ncbi:Domain of uncharacterised function (DUF1837) [Phocoenobacter uteri]|uniref:Domain of uncharacterized function (DUF1837) n=1 Tax=Phocoenobacter uteri TaxID=146806 RepID=A0A379C9R4_9PAST|nr:DUF1837 domain-containing protein [Phocoenobacter uteri]MDG6881100.1 hypothetical protein [Phocoenobacter uteri]SUB59122.1 Domain of uncharacterised function (DUF1837) [Phocoenobacter uteri]
MNIDFKEYLSVMKKDYENIFDKITHNNTINNVDVNLHFKYIKFNPNGDLKIDLLVETLISYFTHYCFSAKKRSIDNNLSEIEKEKQRNKLNNEARKLFRKWVNDTQITSGEAGEMILWLLIEAVLEAPQVVAKMDLKTNPQLESFGSDGINMKVIDNVLNIFFGEAKLYQDIGKALDSIFDSIGNFHQNALKKHECNMVTTHYKYLTEGEKEKVYKFINDNLNADKVKINHACLVGYDWNKYKALNDINTRKSFIDKFEEEYEKESRRLTKLIQKRFDEFSKKTLIFEVFFLPFQSVQELRDKFNDEL